MRFAKGHGTGNDFVVLPDAGDRLVLSRDLVRRLCDRRTGIGADGVLRVVAGSAGGFEGAQWFMDYRNADGGVAEMCGNGIRVMARYLLDRGMAAGPSIKIATRAGMRTVWCEPGEQFSVDMGPATITGKGSADVGGQSLTGVAVSVGNPHLACVVEQPVAAFDLSRPPAVEPGEFPDGVNVEVVRVIGDHAVEMRVYERGSGETWSCGTGAVAAAVAAASADGDLPGRGTDPWLVRVPGGTLTVTLSATASVLAGPAVIVAEGEIEPGWLAEH
jgi:diaminopimelate epimerase